MLCVCLCLCRLQEGFLLKEPSAAQESCARTVAHRDRHVPRFTFFLFLCNLQKLFYFQEAVFSLLLSRRQPAGITLVGEGGCSVSGASSGKDRQSSQLNLSGALPKRPPLTTKSPCNRARPVKPRIVRSGSHALKTNLKFWSSVFHEQAPRDTQLTWISVLVDL